MYFEQFIIIFYIVLSQIVMQEFRTYRAQERLGFRMFSFNLQLIHAFTS